MLRVLSLSNRQCPPPEITGSFGRAQPLVGYSGMTRTPLAGKAEVICRGDQQLVGLSWAASHQANCLPRPIRLGWEPIRPHSECRAEPVFMDLVVWWRLHGAIDFLCILSHTSQACEAILVIL